MFAFVVFDLVFNTKPRDWLGRSPKWPILCRVGHKTLINKSNGYYIFRVNWRKKSKGRADRVGLFGIWALKW